MIDLEREVASVQGCTPSGLTPHLRAPYLRTPYLRVRVTPRVQRHGGRVTTAMSGKTTFLLAGDNCGRSKLRTVSTVDVTRNDEDVAMMQQL